MGGFCKHCGKELNGDEPYCPECGMPTESEQPRTYYAPPKKNNNTAIAIGFVAVIAVLCIIGIALLPILIDTGSSEKYTVTLTVNSFEIDVADIAHQYNGPSTVRDVILAISCSDGFSSLDKQLRLKNGYHVNTNCTDVHDNTMAISVTGDLKDLKFTVFMYYTVVRDLGGGQSLSISDLIDLYAVSPAPGDVKYIGTSGIVFDMSDLSSSGDVTLKGDSDPIGTVNITVTSVKN